MVRGGLSQNWIFVINQLNLFLLNGYNAELLKNHRVFQDKINGGFLAKWLKYTWIHDLWKRLKHTQILSEEYICLIKVWIR